MNTNQQGWESPSNKASNAAGILITAETTADICPAAPDRSCPTFLFVVIQKEEPWQIDGTKISTAKTALEIWLHLLHLWPWQPRHLCIVPGGN
jgi:hypothetical protein